MEQEPVLSLKFYSGIAIIILSFILGKLATAIFFLYYSDEAQRLLAIVLYLLSWGMLFWGIWWVGQEYYGKIRKYLHMKYYHEEVRNRTHRLKAKVREKIQKHRSR